MLTSGGLGKSFPSIVGAYSSSPRKSALWVVRCCAANKDAAGSVASCLAESTRAKRINLLVTRQAHSLDRTMLGGPLMQIARRNRPRAWGQASRQLMLMLPADSPTTVTQ